MSAGDSDRWPDPRHAVAVGLRQPGSETQLTQVLASVLAAEPGLAAAFLRLVANASPGFRFASGVVIPDDLIVKAEEVTPFGRFDLSFRSSTGECLVVVELKIHAEFSPTQIDRYVQALTMSAAPIRLLVAITRDTPRFGQIPPFGGPPAWLGCVSWAQLLKGLRALDISDQVLADQWLFMLDLLEREGAMGFTKVEPRYFDAWLHQRRAVQHLRDLVDAMRVPVRDGLRTAICPDVNSPRWAETVAIDVTSGAGIAVDRSGPNRVYAGLRVPGSGPVHVQFGVASWDSIYFFAELTQLPTMSTFEAASPEMKALVARLEPLGFGLSNPTRPIRAQCDIDDELLASEDLPGDAAAWTVQRLGEAYTAGAFDALRPG